MEFFIDTADLDDIREAASWGILSGVTTNPSLYAKTGGKLADFEDHMVKICHICEGLPVSAESTAETTEGMIAEAEHLASLAPNIVVKLPVTEQSLPAIHHLAEMVTAVHNFRYGYWDEEGGPEIITASVRTPHHVTQAALLGADIATVPFGALKKCVHHPLTDRGLELFAADWAKVTAEN